MHEVSKSLIALAFVGLLIACSPAKPSAQKPSVDVVPSTPWHLMLSHDQDGNIEDGSVAKVVNSVRNGCQHRIAWGGAGRRTVEHVADIKWITVHNDNELKAQIGDFLFNQEFLGDDFPRAEPFGGTDEVVQWRATVKPDGSFNATWYKPHSGALVTRRPQNYPMKWFADCNPGEALPLYPERAIAEE